MSDISIKNLNVILGNKHVLKGINLEVESGKSTVILGGSGSGKSVLLKTIMGLIDYSGIMSVNNQACISGKITHDCGMLFQNGALFDSMNVWRNIMFGARVGFLQRSAAKRKAVELLGMVDLDPEVAELYPESLSGGMKKRVALARTIALNPGIILLDEPTSGLDPITAELINNLILKLLKNTDFTVITVTHDIRSVLSIADYIAMIDDGKISWTGNKDDFLNTDHELVNKFLKASGFLNM